MAFLNQLSEKLDAQQIYDGHRGKYESRFKVNGIEYAFLANTIAGDADDNSQWMLEFENMTSHRIGFGDSDPKIAKAFGEAVGQWIKERAPVNFYTYGSHCDSIKNIIASVKKHAKGYELVDDTADKKNEENGEVIEGNPIGKITWTKMLVQDTVPVVDTVDRESINGDDYKPDYELPKDIKTNKAFMSGTKKSDNLDKGDNAYELKTESSKENEVESYIQKFADKMKGSSRKNAMGWVDGIKRLSKEDREKVKKGIEKYIGKSESFAEFKSKKLNEEYLDEGKGADALKGAARAALKKLQDKMKGQAKEILDIAMDKETLSKWLADNKEDFIHAMDIVKHMTDKKQLTFEEEIRSGSLLKENILDMVAQKSPKTLMAAALILAVMGSGQHVFGKNDSGQDAFSKAKKNIEKIVAIAGEQGGKAAEDIGKHVKMGAKVIEKDIEKTASEVGNAIGNAGDELGDDVKKGLEDAGEKIEKNAGKAGEAIKKGAEEIGDAAKSKADQLKQGFQKFIQKKKAEKKEEPKNEPKKPTFPKEAV